MDSNLIQQLIQSTKRYKNKLSKKEYQCDLNVSRVYKCYIDRGVLRLGFVWNVSQLFDTFLQLIFQN